MSACQGPSAALFPAVPRLRPCRRAPICAMGNRLEESRAQLPLPVHRTLPTMLASVGDFGSRQQAKPEAGAARDCVSAASPAQSSTTFAERGDGRPNHSLVVFSGGTAFNAVATELANYTTRVTHVLPVSDDGGSTAEIVRVLGGPAVGDIRSRCLRLSDSSTNEARAVRKLLGHRLAASDAAAAKAEWYDIVEGEHALWTGLSEPYKHTIRAFLVHFQAQARLTTSDDGAMPVLNFIIRQILAHTSERFTFCHGSVGNFFFAGARLFFRSLDAAIFLYSRVSGIPPDSLVLPAVSTNDRLVLGAELADGAVLRGQNNISHPGMPGTRGVADVKSGRGNPLPAAILRVLYLSSEIADGFEHEVFPAVNPVVIKNLESAQAIVYGMGSLYTSLCPSLVLRGVGEAIAARVDVPKVFMLNGSNDRETAGMDASAYVTALANALNRAHGRYDRAGYEGGAPLAYPVGAYVTHVVAPLKGGVPLDEAALAELWLTNKANGHPDGFPPPVVIWVESCADENGRCMFAPRALVAALSDILGRAYPPTGYPWLDM